MKRILILILCAAIAFSIFACTTNEPFANVAPIDDETSAHVTPSRDDTEEDALTPTDGNETNTPAEGNGTATPADGEDADNTPEEQKDTATITLSDATTALNQVSYTVDNAYHFSDEAFYQKLSAFSSELYELCAKDEQTNYAFSPLSVYMALALLHSVGDDDVKKDVEDLLDMTAEDLAKTGNLFLSLICDKSKGTEDTVTKLDINNSIWLDDDITAGQAALDRLAEDYYCEAFRTPFSADNRQANEDVRAYIKEKTKGLIDQDFGLTEDTIFTLINTLYFKDSWGLSKGLQQEQRTFTTGDEEKTVDFLLGPYVNGLVHQTDVCTYFYAYTLGGYLLKFVLPNEGHTLAQAMTAVNLIAVNSDNKYNGDDKENRYYTRCIFPSFKVESETPLKKIFQSNGYLEHAFFEYTSDLVDAPLAVSDVKHKAVLDVNKEGIEGAAVTIVTVVIDSEDPDTRKKVYIDFVLDRPFGFLLTDPDGVVLFAGQITNP